MSVSPNSLFHADRLEFLERLESNSVQFVYLDPPWFTSWETAELFERNPEEVHKYFSFISETLQQCYRVLDSKGALLIQYEQRFGSNIRLLLDQIFGRDRFVEQYIWPWQGLSNRGRQKRYDILLLYSKAKHYEIPLRTLTEEEIKNRQQYTKKDKHGRYHLSPLFIPNKSDTNRPSLNYDWKGIKPPEKSHWKFSRERLEELAETGLIVLRDDQPPLMKVYLKENYRVPVDLIWEHIPQIIPDTAWRDGKELYPLQRPLALLEQILALGPQPGDTILDPFCGSGTALHAAEKMGLFWLGCDSDQDAFNKTIRRLREVFGLQANEDYVARDSDSLQELPIIHDEYRELLTGLEDDLSYLIAKGESKYVEFKEAVKWNRYEERVDKGMIKNTIKAAVAFMNTIAGGNILIGLTDDGTVIGLAEDYKAVNKQKNNKDGYSLFLTGKLRDELGESAVSLCEITFPTYLNTELCRIKVSPAERPIFYDKNFHVRDGSSSPPLDVQDAFEYIQRRWPQNQE